MILLICALLLGGAVYAYGKGSKWVPLLLLFPYYAASVLLAARLIYPGTPVGFWVLAGLGAGFPLLTLAVVITDMKWGLFCLDTFFGIAFVVFLSPLLLLSNGVALLTRVVMAG